MNNFFTSHGARLAYRVDGPEDAPPLVLVNSIGSTLHMWDAQIPFLSPHLRVVRYDTRGHGSSDVPGGPYTMEQLGLDLRALLDTLQIERAFICGLSLGGVTALWFSITYPERVASAVFANTAARIGSAETWQARIDAVKNGGIAAIQDASLTRFLSEEFRQSHPEETRQIREMIGTTNPTGYIGACEALRETDLREQVASIALPALIIGSELDVSTPPAQAQELHTAIKGSELEIFPGVAHLSNVELPEAFSQRVLNFYR